jgi:hypothetical protein
LPDIDVEIEAVRRLAGAATQVVNGMAALEPQVAGAAQLPGSAFGRIPVVSDLLQTKYQQHVGSATDLFRGGEEAFNGLAATLTGVADAYENNEAEIAKSFTGLLTGPAR